jgi:hypothetical protein
MNPQKEIDMESQPEHCKEELAILELLRELQGVLTIALDSLAHKTSSSPEARYIANAARAVNYSADAYILLREKARDYASKMMVRPMIEIVIKAIAITKQRGLLSAIAFMELKEMKRMYATTPANEAIYQAQVEDMRKGFLRNPNYPIDSKKYTVEQIADVAGLRPAYDTAYRLYCKFTHCAMSALEGHYNELADAEDSTMAVSSVIEILNLLKIHTPATVPDLRPYAERSIRAREALEKALNPNP